MEGVPADIESDLEEGRISKAKAAEKLARWRVEAEALLAERSREKLAAKVAKFVDDWDFYERDELYDEQYDKAKGTQWRLARRIICEQMAALIGAYANAAPHAPEAYAANDGRGAGRGQSLRGPA
jgi:hypothetical protein